MNNKERLSTLNIADYAKEICALKDLSNEQVTEWLQAEAKKEFTEDEKEFARLLKENTFFKYVARDMDNNIYLYSFKPVKEPSCWYDENNSSLIHCNVFHSIKWEDKEPTSLEDIVDS